MSQIATNPPEAPTSRRRFIRQVGALAAVGLGALAVPRLAKAVPFDCCYDPSDCSARGMGCSGNKDNPYAYLCRMGGTVCCICQPTITNCFPLNVNPCV